MTDGRVNGTIPIAAFSFWDFYERAFFKAWEAEHACHELFLLIVASGNTKDVLSVLTAAQEQMSEVIIAVLQKAVVSKAALSSWEVYQILGMDFPALEQVAVCEGAEGLTEGEGVFFGFGVDGLYVDFFGGGRDVWGLRCWIQFDFGTCFGLWFL